MESVEVYVRNSRSIFERENNNITSRESIYPKEK